MAGVRPYGLCLLCLPALIWSGCETPGAFTLQEQRAAVNKLCVETLDELYSQRPEARADIEAAAGYAVFRDGEHKALPAGHGYGFVVDNSNGKRKFMCMAKGTEAKEFRAVFLFTTRDTLERFMEQGWPFNGQGEDDTPRVLQVTDTGISVLPTMPGTRYWWDRSLN